MTRRKSHFAERRQSVRGIQSMRHNRWPGSHGRVDLVPVTAATSSPFDCARSSNNHWVGFDSMDGSTEQGRLRAVPFLRAGVGYSFGPDEARFGCSAIDKGHPHGNRLSCRLSRDLATCSVDSYLFNAPASTGPRASVRILFSIKPR